ncbi:MAG: hypothetical protein Q9227_000089 [Pyrenula ochraceoflavens]
MSVSSSDGEDWTKRAGLTGSSRSRRSPPRRTRRIRRRSYSSDTDANRLDPFRKRPESVDRRVIDDPPEREDPLFVSDGTHTEESSDERSPNTPPEKQSQTDILYRLELCSYLGGVVARTFESDRNFDVRISQRAPVPRQAQVVFEVITQVAGSVSTRRYSRHAPPHYRGRSPLREVSRLEDVDIQRKQTRVVVYSELLLAVLRSFSTYYPNQNMTGTSVIFAEPYAWLLHHLQDLQTFMERDIPDSSFLPAEAVAGLADGDDPPKEAKRQVGLLLEFLQPTIEDLLLPAQALISREIPLVTFDAVWYLFRPGTEIYIRTLDVWHAAIVKKCDTTPVESRGSKRLAYRIYYWSLTCDGEVLGRWGNHTKIFSFEGQKEITSLGLFPTKFWDAKDGGERRKNLVEWGKRLYQAVRQGSKQLGYDGNSYHEGMYNDDPVKKSKYRGRIIIDIRSSRASISDLGAGGFAEEPENMKDNVTGVEPSQQDARLFPWAEYENVKVQEQDTLSDHHFFLFAPAVPGFALSEKAWMMFETQSIQEIPEANDGLANLFMDPDGLEIIKSLSYRQKEVSRTWDADFVRGKGAGQILLLHGPPGVGKTYTVECIAAAFSRPLLALTIADIGSDEGRIERELTKWFDLATSWNAVVLIDEADIFLEQRQMRDLARNGLVSGQIDDAFESRLHAIIEYKPLDDETRDKIWESFFEKLLKDKQGKVIVGPNARRFVLENEAIKSLRWNGREIRNAFQTAVSLAEFQASEEKNFNESLPIIVEREHFEKVCKMSRNFKDYIWKIKKADEAKRANMRKDRYDFLDDEENSSVVGAR